MNTQQPDSFPATIAASPDDAGLDRRLLLGAAGLAGIAAIGSLTSRASAGPLSPPAGAITATGKPIGEIEPRIAVNATNTPPSGTNLFVLPGPGSYYLTGNISVPANRTGIFMGGGATLDLNGFTITGAGSTSTGILASNGCTVRNGSISNVSGAVVVGVNPTVAVCVEDLNVTGFSNRALDLGGRSVVRRCKISGAGVVGIEMQGDYGTVEDCAVTNTSGTGVYVNSYSALRRSTLNGCSIGAFIGYGSYAQACVFSSNNNIGLQASQRSAVHGCVAINTTVGFAGAAGAGIDLGDGAEAIGCSCSSCYYGIRASTAARIIECTADACASSAIRLTGAGNTVEACRLNRSSTGIDMIGTGGNYVHKCVLMGNGNSIAVNVAGNWYPNVALGGVNTATNPLTSVIG